MNDPFLPFYSFNFILLLACAGLFYKAADIEDAPKLLWLGLSILVFFLTWGVLHWGIPGNLLGQAALFGAITVVRVIYDRNRPA